MIKPKSSSLFACSGLLNIFTACVNAVYTLVLKPSIIKMKMVARGG